jgi:nucleoside-diphosphate-sugar epimerase
VAGVLGVLWADYVGPVNVGNPGEFTILELADTVRSVTGKNVDLVHKPLPSDDPTRRRPDITLIGEIAGWKPEIDLKTGLALTSEWLVKELGL